MFEVLFMRASAMSLVIVVSISTSNVRATNHARSITLASFLARAKIAEVEDQVLTQGFIDNDEEEEGDFSDEGHPEIRWTTLIEKIELPTDVTQLAQKQSQDKVNNSNGNPMMAMAGLMGGFMTMLIEPIRVGLEESVRRLSVNDVILISATTSGSLAETLKAQQLDQPDLEVIPGHGQGSGRSRGRDGHDVTHGGRSLDRDLQRDHPTK